MKWGCASLVVLYNEWVILCNAGVVLYNDGVVLCNVFLPCSILRYSVIPSDDWVGAPLGHTVHTLIRDNIERGRRLC